MITNYNTYLKENTDNIDYLKILNDVVDNLNSEFTTPEFNVFKSVNDIIIFPHIVGICLYRLL